MNVCRITRASLALVTIFVLAVSAALVAGGSGAAAGSGAAGSGAAAEGGAGSANVDAAHQAVPHAAASHAAIVDGFLSAYTGGAPGVEVEQWAIGFPGETPSVPGPEIRVQEGDLVRITLDNRHSQPHTLHFHGIISVAQMHDGVPHVSLQVMPGEAHTYEFFAANPGTHAYHCHVDTFTHHDYGMYGALIIEPKDERTAACR